MSSLRSLFDFSSFDPLFPRIVMLDERFHKTFLNKSCINDGCTDDVRVHIGCWSSVFDVALFLSCC